MKERKNIVWIFVAVFLLGVTGCKTTKKTTTTGTGSIKSHNEFFSLMEENAFHFQTLSARLNVELDIPDKNLTSRVDLKMVKDSVFQLSVQPFLGIEVFRIELTTDSIKVLDRMNKRYVAEGYAGLKGQTPIDFNFYNLQALFTNHIFVPGKQTITSRDYSRFKLRQEGSDAEIKIKDSMGLIYFFLTDREEKLLSTQISDAAEKYTMLWKYSDFRENGKQLFPMLMSASVSAKDSKGGSIIMQFSRLQTDVPLKMDFSIPAKYKRVPFAQVVKSLNKK